MNLLKVIFLIFIFIPNICFASGKINCDLNKTALFQASPDGVFYDGWNNGIRQGDQ